jgi:hypothetical protein
MAYCHCGAEIHPLRVKFLENAGYKLTCLVHSTTEKVGGFMATSGKTERELIIGSQESTNALYKASARAGTGVSKGCKMNQSFSHKHFK